jgi:hypothetical protein
MAEPELTDILDRIALGRASNADIEALRSRIDVSGDKNHVQVGQYNVDISGGRNIHIGEQVYQGANADTIRTIIRELVGEPEPTPSRLYVTIVGLCFVLMVAAFVVFGFTLFTTGNQDPDAGMAPGIPIAGAMFGAGFLVAIIATVVRGIVNPASMRSGRGRSWD